MAFDFPSSPTVGQVYQYYTWDGEKWYSTLNGIPYVDPAPIVAAFLARTTGLNSTHINAYTALITGLVADSLWSKFDVLYIFATQDYTTATLNLVSTSYTAILHDLVAYQMNFAADRGFQSANGGTVGWIDTTFNPSTASSPKYTRDSAHFAAWNTDGGYTTVNYSAGGNSAGPSYTVLGYFDFNSMCSIGGINDAAPMYVGTGHWNGLLHINRSGSNTRVMYRNGAVYGADTQISVPVPTVNLYTIGHNNNGTVSAAGHRQGMLSIGSSLTATESTNFYNRLRTYMTAVGAP